MHKLILFQKKTIRRIWHNDEWYFSIVDVIEVLTDSPQPSAYWNKVKKQIESENEFQLLRFWQKLKFAAPDGKMRPTDCANTEGVLRIIMSVPSPKAEPFKLWLAQVGTERIAEIENPELAIHRAGEVYKAKGYPDDWVAVRMKSIGTRNELTAEWKHRGVKEGVEYSILTAEIAKATFGITPSEHKRLKGLTTENLRDHMTDLELIFSMLGEAATKAFAEKDNVQGFDENHQAAQKGGNAAGIARRNMETQLGSSVISTKNFKDLKPPTDTLRDADSE
jgi:hypothetical protein